VSRRIEIQRRAQPVAPPRADDAGESRLVELLRSEIEQHGSLTFARFMARALYEPRLGYYATSEQRPTRGGDFLTAPEMHPLFGHVIARALDEMWQRLARPSQFVLREYGAGSGALGASIVEGLARIGTGLADALDYQPVELPGRQAMAGAGRGAGHGEHHGLGPMLGCVLANEFLDALPVHRVIQRAGALHEVYVTWRDGRFADEVGPLSTPALATWFTDAGVTLADGQRAEVCLAAADWLADVAALLERGYVLAIDYAAEPAALYGADRFNGTLRAFREHHLGRNVLAGVGHQDLTATVDLGALRRAATGLDLGHLGTTSQAEFLVGSGLAEALADERAHQPDDLAAQLLLRSVVARLLDPRALGGYRVIVLGREVPTEPPLAGLAYRIVPA
jgi:SAM-dependent MidA family methyltransferase